MQDRRRPRPTRSRPPSPRRRARTRAPLACVVAEASAGLRAWPRLAAAALRLARPGRCSPSRRCRRSAFSSSQLARVRGCARRARLRAGARALASRARRRSACHRAAVVQFSRRGLDAAPERNGALLYVSLAERYARIVADVGLEHPAGRMAAAGRRNWPRRCKAGDAKAALSTAAATHAATLLAPISRRTPGRQAAKAQALSYVVTRASLSRGGNGSNASAKGAHRAPRSQRVRSE